MSNVLYRRLGTESDAAFTTVTNTTTETALKSFTLPARTVQVRSGIRFRAQVKTPSTDSTDTVALKLYIGSTAVATVAAFDAANNDGAFVEFEGVIDPAANLAHGRGLSGRTGQALATPTITNDLAAVLTGDVVFSVKAQWSVAAAANQCVLKVFNLEIFPEDCR